MECLPASTRLAMIIRSRGRALRAAAAALLPSKQSSDGASEVSLVACSHHQDWLTSGMVQVLQAVLLATSSHFATPCEAHLGVP